MRAVHHLLKVTLEGEAKLWAFLLLLQAWSHGLDVTMVCPLKYYEVFQERGLKLYSCWTAEEEFKSVLEAKGKRDGQACAAGKLFERLSAVPGQESTGNFTSALEVLSDPNIYIPTRPFPRAAEAWPGNENARGFFSSRGAASHSVVVGNRF